MKRLIFLLFGLLVMFFANAQVSGVYQIKGADTVKLLKVGGTINPNFTEFVLMNNSDTVPGFLFNTGLGITRFKRPLTKINSSTYLVGVDTLFTNAGGVPGGVNTNVQLNYSGNFTGVSNLTFDTTKKALIVGGSSNTVNNTTLNNFVLGNNNTNTGNFGATFGFGNLSGAYGYAFGSGNTVSNYSISVGATNGNTNNYSATFGNNLINTYPNSLVVGQFNDTTPWPNAAMASNPNLVPIFSIGNGTTNTARQNVFTILRNGKLILNLANNATLDSSLTVDQNGNVVLKKFAFSTTVNTQISVTGNGSVGTPVQLVNDSIFTSKPSIPYFVGRDTTGRFGFQPNKYVVAKQISELRQLQTGDTSLIYRANINGVVSDFVWSPTSVAMDDSVMTLKAVPATGRLLRFVGTPYVNVRWFGALGDGTDQTYKIQKAINWVVNNFSVLNTVFFPAGAYSISSPLLMINWNGSSFAQATVNLLGPNSEENTSVGRARILPTYNNTFAIGMQQCKDCSIKNLSIEGQYSLISTFNQIQIDTMTLAQLWDGSARNSSITPYAGIAIDFASDSTSYANPNDQYPGLHGYNLPGMGRAGSTRVTIENCTITHFWVGSIISPSNQANGEIILHRNVNWGGNAVGFAICQSQSKDIGVEDFQVWDNCHTVFDNTTFGIRHADGAGLPQVLRGNIAGNVYQLCSLNASTFRGSFKDVYAEGLFKIGLAGGLSGLEFHNCDLNFAFIGRNLPYPDFFTTGTNVVFDNCQLRLYGAPSGSKLILSGVNAKFFGGTTNYPPAIANLNVSISQQKPVFERVQMYYGNGIIGGNTTSPYVAWPISTLTFSDPVYPGTNTVANTANSNAIEYGFTYNSDYDRIKGIGNQTILVNKSTWTAKFFAGTTNINYIQPGDMLLTTGPNSYQEGNSLTTYPIGFVDSLNRTNDTVYIRNVAVGIQNNTVYGVYVNYSLQKSDQFIGNVAVGDNKITKVRVANGSTATSYFPVGSRWDLPMFSPGTFVTSVGNDTVYLSTNSLNASADTTNTGAYSFMNGYPQISMRSTHTPEASLSNGIYGNAYYYYEPRAINNPLGYSNRETYYIFNPVYNSDTSVYKLKYSIITSESRAKSIPKGTTAQSPSNNYLVGGLIRVNTDSTQTNGIAHATVDPGTGPRTLAYLSDITGGGGGAVLTFPKRQMYAGVLNDTSKKTQFMWPSYPDMFTVDSPTATQTNISAGNFVTLSTGVQVLSAAGSGTNPGDGGASSLWEYFSYDNGHTWIQKTNFVPLANVPGSQAIYSPSFNIIPGTDSIICTFISQDSTSPAYVSSVYMTKSYRATTWTTPVRVYKKNTTWYNANAGRLFRTFKNTLLLPLDVWTPNAGGPGSTSRYDPTFLKSNNNGASWYLTNKTFTTSDSSWVEGFFFQNNIDSIVNFGARSARSGFIKMMSCPDNDTAYNNWSNIWNLPVKSPNANCYVYCDPKTNLLLATVENQTNPASPSATNKAGIDVWSCKYEQYAPYTLDTTNTGNSGSMLHWRKSMTLDTTLNGDQIVGTGFITNRGDSAYVFNYAYLYNTSFWVGHRQKSVPYSSFYLQSMPYNYNIMQGTNVSGGNPYGLYIGGSSVNVGRPGIYLNADSAGNVNRTTEAIRFGNNNSEMLGMNYNVAQFYVKGALGLPLNSGGTLEGTVFGDGYIYHNSLAGINRAYNTANARWETIMQTEAQSNNTYNINTLTLNSTASGTIGTFSLKNSSTTGSIGSRFLFSRDMGGSANIGTGTLVGQINCNTLSNLAFQSSANLNSGIYSTIDMVWNTYSAGAALSQKGMWSAEGNLVIGPSGDNGNALLQLGPGSSTLSAMQFTNATPKSSLVAGQINFNTGLLMLDSTSAKRDTLATRSWVRNNTGTGGSQTWQQVFGTQANRSILTVSDTVTNTGQTFVWNNGWNGSTGIFKFNGVRQDTANLMGVMVAGNDSSMTKAPWATFALKLAPYLPIDTFTFKGGVSASGTSTNTTVILGGSSIPNNKAFPLTNDSVIAFNAANTAYKMPFGIAGKPGNIFAQTANGPVITNTTTASTLLAGGAGSLVIPANSLSVGEVLHFHTIINLTTAASSPGWLQYIFANNAFTNGYQSLPPANYSGKAEVDIYVTILTIGATGTETAAWSIRYTGSNEFSDIGASSTNTIDTTVANTLDIRGAWQTALAGNSVNTLTPTHIKIE